MINKVRNRTAVFILMTGAMLFALGITLFIPAGASGNTPQPGSEFEYTEHLSKDIKVSKIQFSTLEREKVEERVIVPFTLTPIGSYTLTAYCPCPICCEQYSSPALGKRTAIGVGAYPGLTVAVDPRKIPYGTKLYIEGVGVCIATDCGGAIKGNRIDVYYTDHQAALTSGFGMVPRDVYIIKD